MSVRPHRERLVRFVLALLFAAALTFSPGFHAWSAEATDAKAQKQTKASGDTPVELPSVQVTGKQESSDGSVESGYRYDDASVGPLGKTPLRDTPYSIHVTSGELIRNRGAHTQYDALKTNPAVSSLMSSFGYSSMSRVMIRGFSASDQNDMRDGLVDRSFTVIPFENVERVEVMNGMSGFLYGFSTPGGAVNYITKQPPEKMYVSADTGFYAGKVFYGHVDVGGPISPTNDRLSFRINAALEGGETYLDDSNMYRNFVSAIVKYKLGESTTIWADFWNQYFTQDGIQSYFSVDPGAGIGVPSASDFSARKQYGQSWTYNHARKTVGGVGFESKLNDTFTLRSAFRYGDMWREYRYVTNALTTTPGVYTESATASPRSYETTRSAYALMDATFDTWSFSHKLTFGYSGTGFVFKRGKDVTQTLGTSNINAISAFFEPAVALGSSNLCYREDMDNFILGDRIDLTEKISVLAGVTYAMYNLNTNSDTWGGPVGGSHQFQTAFTPTLALMYKPWKTVTTYASYMEGLAGGGIAPTTYGGKAVLNAGEVMKPSISRQYEVGAKATFGKLDLGAALFYIDKVNEFTDSNTLTYKQDGREVHKGVEVNATGRLTDNLSLTGGFTFMDARMEKTNSAATEGKVPVNVPDKQARLYMEYNLPFAKEVTVAAGVFHNGKRYVDTQNISYLSESTTFDAGLRYEPKVLGHDVCVNLNVKNIFDTSYWSYYSKGNGGLFLGEPRTVTLSLKATW